ncbi:MAG: hypothetical protein IT310_10630 [Anaerolineales bacterium]|nr:hypothetical protein [Anaerolineales bacterium]
MKNIWYSLSLGDGMTADEPAEEIRAAFQELYPANEAKDIAVFTRNESEGRLHCAVIAYFSPAAEALALLFDAEPCSSPVRSGLGLLAGDSGSWARLFPESEA